MKAIYLIFLLNYFFATTTNPAFTSNTKPFSLQLSEAALAIINPNVKYDPIYCSIKYPNGDVPKNKGVCTDVVIRAYRKLNIDLQKEVHEDMKANFSKYPNLKKWGMKKTDTNIDKLLWYEEIKDTLKQIWIIGDHFPFNDRPIIYTHFAFPLNEDASVQLLKIDKRHESLQIPYQFLTIKQLQAVV